MAEMATTNGGEHEPESTVDSAAMTEFPSAEYGPVFAPMQRTSPLVRELRETLAKFEAQLRGETVVVVRASRAQAEREYAVALAAVRAGAEIRVVPGTIRP
jgi:hypothetical protein